MTLIGNLFRRNAKKIYGENFFSDEFLSVMDEKLTENFKMKTRIQNDNNYINLDLSNIDSAIYSQGSLQTLSVVLRVVNCGFHVNVCWKMNSDMGLPYRPFHTNIDSERFTMWFEELPIKEIFNEFYKSPPVLAIDKNILPYSLTINFFFWESVFLVINHDLKKNVEITQLIENTINNWNEKSEAKNRLNGVFHSSRLYRDKEKEIVYYIDTGSALESGLVKILEGLSTLEYLDSITVTSFIDY